MVSHVLPRRLIGSVGSVVTKVNTDLAYPAFMFFKGGKFVETASNADQLGVCNKRALKDNCFDGVTIVTIKGEKLVVKSAKPTGILKPWWTSPLFLVLLKTELEMEEIGSASLEEVKSILLKSFRQNPQLFYGFDSYKEFADVIGKCGSFPELLTGIERS